MGQEMGEAQGSSTTEAKCNTQRVALKKAALKCNSAAKLLFIVILSKREGFAKIQAFSPHLSSRKFCGVRNNAPFLRMTHETTPFTCFESVVLSMESNEKVEAEILNDLAHIVSDYLTALAPTTYLLRFLLILGRLLGISSGYVSEHTVLLDELFLQAVPLAFLSVLLIKSVVPMAQSMLIATDASDKEAYNLLFSPVGISWAQFKTLKVTALNWIEVPPGTLLVGEVDSIRNATSILHPKETVDKSTENENTRSRFPPLFWLYKGDVVFSLKGTTITYTEQSEATSINDPSSVGLMSDMRFLYALDSPKLQVHEQQALQLLKYFLKGNNSKMNTMLDTASKEYLLTTINAGSNGARLLRINSERLRELLELDDQLRNSFRTLILTSLQRQASNLLKILSERLDKQNDRELDSNFGLEFEE